MAVTITPQKLAAHLRIVTSDTQPIPGPYVTVVVDSLQAVTALVERRAPLAPTDTQNMAVTQIAGYWWESPQAAARRFGFNAWQHSGAAQLLAPFIERRAEPV